MGLFACFENRLRCSIVVIVAVLHRNDAKKLARTVILRQINVGNANISDLPGAAQIGQRSKGVLERHLRVGAVELKQRDGLETQSLETVIATCAQMIRPAICRPSTRAGSLVSRLSGDHQVSSIWV